MRALRIAIPFVFLGVGTAVAWLHPEQPVGLALLLLAALSTNLTDRGGLILIVTGLATLGLATPHIVDQIPPTPLQTLWFAALWVAAALLIWDPRRTKLDVVELTSAFEQAPTGFIITTLDGKILSANRAFRSIATNISRNNDLSQLAPNGWQYIIENQDALFDGEAIHMDFSTEVNDVLHPLSGYAKLVRDRRQAPLHYVIQLTDQSSERAATKALAATTDQMHRLLSSSSDLVFLVNHKLVLTFANETACQMLNTASQAFEGMPIYNTIKTTDRRVFMKALETLTTSARREVHVGEITFLGNTELKVEARLIRLNPLQNTGYAMVCKESTSLAELEEAATSQARFSQVFHGSPDAILLLRANDNLILDFNDGFTRLLGYSREDAIGECGLESNFWNNVVERDAVVAKLMAEKEVIGYETTLRTHSGQVVHVEISLRYVEIDGDLSILCIGRDITKRISAEAALVETEEKFEKAFNHSPDGFVIIRQADGVITDLNEAFVEKSGYRRDELIDKPFHMFIDNTNTEELEEFGAALANSAKPIANQAVTFTSKTGEVIPSLISATILELSGEPYVMVVAKDISKQRATEERLRRSEERFRGIFENAPIGILLVDLKGHISQANHTAAALLAYDEQHMNGIHISRLVPHEDRITLKHSLNRLITDKSHSFKVEQRLLCQNGMEVWSKMHIVLQHSSRDEPLYYIVQITDISDIKRGQQRMEQMAFYDTLTKLANRRLFQDRLNQTIDQCARYSRSAALLYLDLDNFKRVNDTLGHQTGDDLLREVAVRLGHCVRKEDTVGRTGGDEFTILLNNIATPSDAGLVAQKILNHLREPIEIGGHPLVVTTSIGVTILPTDGKDPNTLMRNADLAMYKAKERGRNNYQFYSEDLNANAVKRLRTEYEIRQALENDEFVLFYQPKVSLQTREIVGVECLIRWQHPTRGLLTPDEFIEIAEDTGNIIPMGSWVIEEACRASKELSANHDRPIEVAINISPRQFRDPNLVNTVRRGIREQQLDPRNIELEITETMLMQDVEAAETTVMRLSELGVKLAIDDFGTGYSSLNYLKRFPINTVKVDRSFVMDLPGNPDDLAITRAVIAMAHQLKMEVVAEGVETKEQLEFLAAERCEYAQGYLFAKPLPLAEIAELIHSGSSVIHGGRG